MAIWLMKATPRVVALSMVKSAKALTAPRMLPRQSDAGIAVKGVWMAMSSKRWLSWDARLSGSTWSRPLRDVLRRRVARPAS